jgi:hypothetical protein
MGRKKSSCRPFFERLKQGLEEGIAHVKGELTLRTIEVPEEPSEIDAKPPRGIVDEKTE